MKRHSLWISLLSVLLLATFSARADESSGAGNAAPARSAHDVYLDMLESSVFEREIPIPIAGYEDRFATYGAEKEGSSSIITRVMGPNKEEFKRLLGKLNSEQKATFQRDFLKNWVSGKYRQRNVVDATGAVKDFDYSEFRRINWEALSPEELDAKFNSWLEKAGDRSFSFVSSNTRRKFFNGELPGLEPLRSGKRNRIFNYNGFVSHYGDPEKYIRDAHSTGPGWELNFVPQNTYGAHDKMVSWFRKTMGVNGSLFEAPGHQWNVFSIPKEVSENPEKLAQFKSKLGELLRGIQALIVVRGMGGRSGMSFTNYKSVHSDYEFDDVFSLGRGVLRTATKSEFGDGRFGVELRSGTKTDDTRRFIQEVLTSRIATGDFSGIEDLGKWKLHSATLDRASVYTERFGVSEEVAKKFLEKIGSIKKFVRDSDRRISLGYLTPLWQWENAPFLSKEKKTQLRNLTKSFIESVAKSENLDADGIETILQDWTKASRIEADLKHYLQPRAPPVTSTAELLTYKAASNSGFVDVNKIHLGIEYTGRFQVKPRVITTEEKLANGKAGWIATTYDLTPIERDNAMRMAAEDLAKELGVGSDAISKTEGGHGHGLGTAYFVKDQEGRSWRVEWDGVTREYDLEGLIMPESLRGGHVELVTPKVELTANEVDKVFAAFGNEGLLPDPASGGGHINVDLAVFDGKPKKFARFLALFLENRGVMGLMFQHVDRLKSAEPLEVSPKLIQSLRNFNGSEADLKKLLYNERWFNQRVGRKSRYTQMDIASYFQDVIPEEFLTKEFDLFKDMWRKSFKVDPKIRKAELRLFNAPRTARESALQAKFVRALLHKALNEDGQLSGTVQEVDHVAYAKNPQKAEKDFQRTMQVLGLDPKEYREFLLDGLTTTRSRMNSINFVPLERRLAMHPKVGGWGEAVDPRPAHAAIVPETRVWDGRNPDPEAVRYHQMRQQVREQRARIAERGSRQIANRLQRSELDKLGIEAWRTLPEDEVIPFLFSFKNNGSIVEKETAERIFVELRQRGNFRELVANAIKRAGSEPYANFLAGELDQFPEPLEQAIRNALQAEFPSLKAAGSASLGRLPSDWRADLLLKWFSETLTDESGEPVSKILATLDTEFDKILPNPIPDDFLDPRLELTEQIARSKDSPAEHINRAMASLQKYVKYPKPHLREGAALVLEQMMTHEVNPELQIKAAGMLFDGLQGDGDSLPKIREFLRHQNRSIAQLAKTAYQHTLFDVFLKAEKVSDYEKVASAAKALDPIDYVNTMRSLVSSLNSRGETAVKAISAALVNENLTDLVRRGEEVRQSVSSLVEAAVEEYGQFPETTRSEWEKVFRKFYSIPETAEAMDKAFAENTRYWPSRAVQKYLVFLKKNLKKPSSKLIEALVARLEWDNQTRDQIIGALMQWKPEGPRALQSMSGSNAAVRAILGKESCQRYFQGMGL